MGDHVKSNQTPIKTSSSVGRRLLPWSTHVPGSSAGHLPSLPCTRASPPLPHQDGPSFSNTPDTRGGMGQDILLPARPSSPAPRSPPSLDGPLCPRATSLRKGGYGCNDPSRQHLSSEVRAQAGISLRTLSTTPGLSPSLSRHLLRHCLGQIPRDGAHIYSLDLGQGLGTGLSPASSPESAGWGSAPKWWLWSPRARGDPRGDSAHLQGGREGTHKKGQGGSEEDRRLRCAAEG